LIVQCADERSQLKNKARALTVLRSRLLKQREEEEHAKYAAARRSQIGSGDRSERIRTYNFPQNRVTDHRIGLTLYNLPQVMEGDIDEIIAALQKAEFEEKLAALTGAAVSVATRGSDGQPERLPAGLYLFLPTERLLDGDWDPQRFEREDMGRFLVRHGAGAD